MSTENRMNENNNEYDYENRNVNRNGNGNGNGNGGNQGGNGEDGKKPNSKLMLLAIAAVITVLSVYFLSSMYEGATSKEITYDAFLEMLDNGEVQSVKVTGSGKVIITPKGQSFIKKKINSRRYKTKTSRSLGNSTRTKFYLYTS